METLEGLKELAGVVHIESGPIVTDKINRLAILPGNTNFNSRPGQFTGKLPGITQQVLECQAQEIMIPISGDFRRYNDLGFPLRSSLSELRQDIAGHFSQVDFFVIHIAPCNAGKLEKVIDQTPHQITGFLNIPEVLLAPVIQFTGIIIQQSRAEAFQAP